jgi:hypothetical protein
MTLPIVAVKPGAEFTTIAPGGFCILSAIQQASQRLNLSLTITSACDGEHSGPDDPHHRGEAYDVRTHDLQGDAKFSVLAVVLDCLPPGRFFGFLEDAYTANEHLHFQVKKGTTYP